MRRIAPICLLLLSLCVGIGLGRAAERPLDLDAVERPTDLTSAWTVRRGDDPAWAGVDVDASAWAPVNIADAWTATRFADFEGVSWFRADLRLPWGRAEAARH